MCISNKNLVGLFLFATVLLASTTMLAQDSSDAPKQDQDETASNIHDPTQPSPEIMKAMETTNQPISEVTKLKQAIDELRRSIESQQQEISQNQKLLADTQSDLKAVVSMIDDVQSNLTKGLQQAQNNINTTRSELKEEITRRPPALPNMKLMGIVFGQDNQPMHNHAIVAIDKEHYRIEEGQAIHLVLADGITTLECDKVHETGIELKLMPQNISLSLR